MAKHTRLIILDYDHTMFNTTKFVSTIQQRFVDELGIAVDEFMRHREKIKECNHVIDIDTFVTSFPGQHHGTMHEIIHQTLKDCASNWIFDDVDAFIRGHQEKFDIKVITNGDAELQTEKVGHAKLPKNIQVLISTKEKDEVITPLVPQYEEIHFIDDKARNLERIKQAFPSIITYFIVRPEDHPYANACPDCDAADHRIENLAFTIA